VSEGGKRDGRKNVTMALTARPSPARLYRMYLDPKQHAALTGAPVKIEAKARRKVPKRLGCSERDDLAVLPNV